MSVILSISDITTKNRAQVGGKAFALAEMRRQGLPVPHALCITTNAYSRYLDQTGLQDFIALELNRKRFEDMRWEELWDTALRIQNMFLKTPIPQDLKKSLEHCHCYRLFFQVDGSPFFRPWRRFCRGVLCRAPRILCEH